MPNIQSVLREEIARLAKKTIKAELESLKKASSHHRSEIAALKQRIIDLSRDVKRLSKQATNVAPPDHPASNTNIRYSARSVAAQRRRLGLSAEQFGKLFGVTGQTVYNWEQDKARPKESQMPAIVAARKLSKSDAKVIIEQLSS
jgi:DNA-binding transcriptional regulator YiaG